MKNNRYEETSYLSLKITIRVCWTNSIVFLLRLDDSGQRPYFDLLSCRVETFLVALSLLLLGNMCFFEFLIHFSYLLQVLSYTVSIRKFIIFVVLGFVPYSSSSSSAFSKKSSSNGYPHQHVFHLHIFFVVISKDLYRISFP